MNVIIERMMRDAIYCVSIDDVIQDLEEIIKAREAATKSKEEGITFWIAMKIPVYRNVLIIGCLLAAFQQFIGINVFVAASNKLFEDAGLNKGSPFIVNVFFIESNFFISFCFLRVGHCDEYSVAICKCYYDDSCNLPH